jgi:tetratricopeptide (TPR) repeat protein
VVYPSLSLRPNDEMAQRELANFLESYAMEPHYRDLIEERLVESPLDKIVALRRGVIECFNLGVLRSKSRLRAFKQNIFSLVASLGHQAHLLFAWGRYLEASETYGEAIEIVMSLPWLMDDDAHNKLELLLINQGSCHLCLGNYEHAIFFYKAALKYLQGFRRLYAGDFVCLVNAAHGITLARLGHAKANGSEVDFEAYDITSSFLARYASKLAAAPPPPPDSQEQNLRSWTFRCRWNIEQCRFSCLCQLILHPVVNDDTSKFDILVINNTEKVIGLIIEYMVEYPKEYKATIAPKESPHPELGFALRQVPIDLTNTVQAKLDLVDWLKMMKFTASPSDHYTGTISIIDD